MKYSILFILSLLFFTVACNNEATTTKNEPIGAQKKIAVDESEDVNSQFIKSSAGRDYTHKRSEALSILKFRTEKDADNYPIITDGVFEYAFIHDGKQMSASGAHNNEWLDFKSDLTYTYGKEKKQTGSGKFHYEFEKALLLMIDDDKTVNPQEWEVKRQNNVMIIVGTTVYGNNNFQIKLMNHDNIDEMIASHIK